MIMINKEKCVKKKSYKFQPLRVLAGFFQQSMSAKQTWYLRQKMKRFRILKSKQRRTYLPSFFTEQKIALSIIKIEYNN